MLSTIYGKSVPEAYVDGLWKLRIEGKERDTRNGVAVTIPNPVHLIIGNPERRVLFCPVRDANPFFHCFEFLWMLAQRNDAEWLSQFVPRISNYAEDNGKIWGAYGVRWGKQIESVIDVLKKDPTTRQAVLAMWNPELDLTTAPLRDRPCNTHIYLSIDDGNLTMRVMNRSNDFIWGMLGANAVHMTMLMEVIAHQVGVPMGRYEVISNNLHIYKDIPRFEQRFKTIVVIDPYRTHEVAAFPILQGDETLELLRADAIAFCNDEFPNFHTRFVREVAFPMREAWFNRSMETARGIQASDWRRACIEWLARREQEPAKEALV